MPETIMSREAIARSADEAAEAWARNPDGPKPQNPFDAIVQPEHHRVWACDFERQLVRHSCPDSVERSA